MIADGRATCCAGNSSFSEACIVSGVTYHTVSRMLAKELHKKLHVVLAILLFSQACIVLEVTYHALSRMLSKELHKELHVVLAILLFSQACIVLWVTYHAVNIQYNSRWPFLELELCSGFRISLYQNCSAKPLASEIFASIFYPRDTMLARVIAIATCPSVCPSVCLSVRPSRAGIVSKRRKLASWFLHRLVAPRL